jgi:pseudouridine synthase
VILEDGRTSPAEVNVLKPVSTGSVLQMTIREGRNRQLRRMCEKLGFNVVRLRRTKIGPLSLGKLPLGAARRLTFQEINDLYRAVGL